MQEGRGWNEESLPAPTTDAQNVVALGLGDERLQWSVG
jgi:hypothetical protein